MKIFIYNETNLVETEPSDKVDLNSLNDVFAFCCEKEAERVLIHSEGLQEGFFDLSTRIAGEILQKFSTYPVKAAILIAPGTKCSSMFTDFIAELDRRGGIRFFENKTEAVEWLAYVK